MRASIEESILDFLGRQIFRMNGINQEALAKLNLESELIHDVGLNTFQLDFIVQSFKKQYNIDCCEKQFANSKAKVIYLLDVLSNKAQLSKF